MFSLKNSLKPLKKTQHHFYTEVSRKQLSMKHYPGHFRSQCQNLKKIVQQKKTANKYPSCIQTRNSLRILPVAISSRQRHDLHPHHDQAEVIPGARGWLNIQKSANVIYPVNRLKKIMGSYQLIQGKHAINSNTHLWQKLSAGYITGSHFNLVKKL